MTGAFEVSISFTLFVLTSSIAFRFRWLRTDLERPRRDGLFCSWRWAGCTGSAVTLRKAEFGELTRLHYFCAQLRRRHVVVHPCEGQIWWRSDQRVTSEAARVDADLGT